MTKPENLSKQWREEEALRRYQLIAPLLTEESDEAKLRQLRQEIADRNQISVRSLYRYEDAWRKGGFSGLKPADRTNHHTGRLPENFEELLAEAIQLKREVPKRSVATIIQVLELEGRVAPGVLKRSTLERHLYQAGFGVKQLAAYREARESSSKRFCKPHRMMLIQGDIKYGPKLPIGKNGAKIQTYLSSAMDDHSRFLLHSCFYANQEETIVEDTFRKAILKYGRFDSCYFDNGTQYIARQLNISLSRLGIRIRHARPRSGKSKGKIEKFHQVVDAFLREVRLKDVRTLEDLNYYWAIYLEEAYQNTPHDGIREYYESLGAPIPEAGISPRQEFYRDTRTLTYLDTSVVTEAFLHHEERKVDKGACISVAGKKYETHPSLIGFTVEISYDPAVPEVITVRYPGMEPFRAKPVRIGSFCDKNPTLPVSLQQPIPGTSRVLDAYEQKNELSRRQQADAISFASYRKEAADHV